VFTPRRLPEPYAARLPRIPPAPEAGALIKTISTKFDNLLNFPFLAAIFQAKSISKEHRDMQLNPQTRFMRRSMPAGNAVYFA
jgi:hypothetical protein